LNFVALSSHISFALLCRGCFVYRAKNMNSPAGGINLILVILLCVCVGCHTPEKKEAHKDDPKEATELHFHVEANPDPAGRTIQVPVLRSRPILITVERDAVLDEGYLTKAQVVDTDEMGGYAIKLTFDDRGTRRLNQVTLEHRGQHLAINAAWLESRWIAAPLLTHRITNGEFIFTPDATREESERIVAGLQHVIQKLHEPYTIFK